MKRIVKILVFLTLVMSVPAITQASSDSERTSFGRSYDTKRTSGVGWSTLGYWITGEKFDSDYDPQNSSLAKTYMLLDGGGEGEYDIQQKLKDSTGSILEYEYTISKTDAQKLIEKLKLKENNGKVSMYLSTIFGLDPYSHEYVQAVLHKAGSVGGSSGKVTLPNKTALGYFTSLDSITGALSWGNANIRDEFKARYNMDASFDMDRHNAVIETVTTDGMYLPVYSPDGRITETSAVTVGYYGQMRSLVPHFVDPTGDSYYLVEVYFEPSDNPVKHRLFRKSGDEFVKTDVKTNGGASAKYGSAAYQSWFNKLNQSYYRMGTKGTTITCVYTKYKPIEPPPTNVDPSADIIIEYVEKEFEDPYPIAEIAAMDVDNNKFDVEDGIPSSEKVYATANSEEFLLGYRLKGTTVTKRFQVPVVYNYTYAYTQSELAGYDKDGKAVWIDVEYTSPASTTSIQEVVRVYQHWEVENFEAYQAGGVTIKNDATGQIVLTPSLAKINGNFKNTVSVSNDAYVWNGQSVQVNLGRYSYSYKPSDSDAKSRAEAVVKQYKVKNDTLEFNGTTILNGTEVEGKTARPTEPSESSITLDGVYLKTDVKIPDTTKNKVYDSEGVINYKSI